MTKLKSNPNIKLGRYCELNNLKEYSDLKYGMDFRKPEYRREVFLRFYEAHLKYKVFPGLVYLFFPYLSKKLNMTQEQKYWFAYINGCCQNPCTTWAVFSEFPNFEKINFNDFENWHKENWKLLDYDTDKRHSKGHLIKMSLNYKDNLRGMSQVEYFENHLYDKESKKHFRKVWDEVIKNFLEFGRLSTFSYLEYLKIMGLNIEYDTFFMDDLNGSKSHRNGILKVCGRDDLEWYDKFNPEIKIHTKEICDWAEEQAFILLNEAKERFKDREFIKDVGPQTMESALCTFKSTFREKRRYFNVYTDMSYNRIKKAESLWGNRKDFSLFWQARKECLPEHLLLECNPQMPGLVPEKQNHFRNTGQVIMMDKEWDCFKNDFNDKYDKKNLSYVKKSLF